MSRVVLVVWGLEAFGGMERHVCELALALHHAGIDVAVVSEMPVGRSNPYAKRLRAGGVSLHAPPIALRAVNGLTIAAQPSSAQRLIHGGGPLSNRLGRTLAMLTKPGDLIHIHGCRLGQSWLIDWAHRRGLATVYTEHVAIAESGGPLVADGAALASTAGAIACVSDQSRRSLARFLPRDHPIEVLGHIVTAPPHPARAERSGEPLNLVCIARLEPRKGIDTLLAAMAELVTRTIHVSLTIVGGGPLKSDMSRLASKLGVAKAVHFAGQVSPDEAAKAMAQADTVVIASRSEGLPLVLLEAMAGGKAIVATAAGGIPEVLRDRDNGLLVPIDDPAALATAIAEIAGDDGLRAQLGRRALECWEGSPHRADRVVPDILRLYRQAEAAC